MREALQKVAHMDLVGSLIASKRVITRPASRRKFALAPGTGSVNKKLERGSKTQDGKVQESGNNNDSENDPNLTEI